MTQTTPAAIISPCGLYRYRLSRSWANGAHLTFIMLNPSTADANVDDPTIRRCMGFARREGVSGIHVVNLFAFRATKPEDMANAVDPEGPENARYLADAAELASHSGLPLVCAWGSHWMASDRAESVVRGIGCHASLSCLGTTKSGAPRHPLYVKGNAPLVLFGEPRT